MAHSAVAATALTPYCLRLSPGDDLKQCLQSFTESQAIAAGCILTTVGSLQQASLRFAGQDRATLLTGRFEIVSLVGTLSPEGLHLHLAIADSQGQMIGGHVMPGCLIYTTAEIVVGGLSGVTFQRRLDAQTGYRELEIAGGTPDESTRLTD
ncbi:PPC domain-containing DNA-binding protein [Leptolyngbya iicbica]|uniref:DNA-binding protein n=2 Tax=Cyanophyceae TaxID=3028117 RepID=A0A4Q7EG55_9CYAN|nr:PPC domain-containing DNA-binding protein [Leptolyngbya sp. LK]RZM82242.1 DNA-binding protein [Leptolyngbya sp. LK]